MPERLFAGLFGGLVLVLLACEFFDVLDRLWLAWELLDVLALLWLAWEMSLVLACLVLVACWLLSLFCSIDRLTAVSLFCFSGACLVLSLELLWAETEIAKSNIDAMIIIFFMTLSFYIRFV
jgi:hypothetical protein